MPHFFTIVAGSRWLAAWIQLSVFHRHRGSFSYHPAQGSSPSAEGSSHVQESMEGVNHLKVLPWGPKDCCSQSEWLFEGMWVAQNVTFHICGIFEMLAFCGVFSGPDNMDGFGAVSKSLWGIPNACRNMTHCGGHSRVSVRSMSSSP